MGSAAVRALREAFEADRVRQMHELRREIGRLYGPRAQDAFTAWLWWGWDFKVGTIRPWAREA